MGKRLFVAFLLLTLIVACEKTQNDIETQIKGVSIIAMNESTRTSFNGESTEWSEGDVLQVMIGEVGDILSVEDFSLKASLGNTFVNEELVLNPNATYNAYAIYSSCEIEQDVANATAVVAVGASIQEQQAQSASHIASYDPLYGKSDATFCDNICMTMKHTAVVLKINVKNTTGEVINGIKTLKITAPESVNLYGKYQLDFSTLSTSLADSSGSNTVIVNIDSSGEIDANEEFTVWAATAPFMMQEDTSLDFEITTTEDKVLEFSKSFTNETKFLAGCIMETSITPMPRVEQFVLKWGYLSGYTTPINMPSSSYNDIENVVNSVTQFPIGEHYIVIDSDCKFAYLPASGSGSGYIRFSGISQTKEAYIRLPMIPNYRLSNVKSYITETSAEANRSIKISIEAHAQNSFIPIAKTTNEVCNEYNLIDKTSSEYQYSMRIFYSANNNRSANCDLTGIELTYVLDE